MGASLAGRPVLINLVAPGFNSGWETIMGPDARNTPSLIGTVLNNVKGESSLYQYYSNGGKAA